MMKDQILIKSEKCATLSLPPSKQPAQSVNAFNQVSLVTALLLLKTRCEKRCEGDKMHLS